MNPAGIACSSLRASNRALPEMAHNLIYTWKNGFRSPVATQGPEAFCMLKIRFTEASRASIQYARKVDERNVRNRNKNNHLGG